MKRTKRSSRPNIGSKISRHGIFQGGTVTMIERVDPTRIDYLFTKEQVGESRRNAPKRFERYCVGGGEVQSRWCLSEYELRDDVINRVRKRCAQGPCADIVHKMNRTTGRFKFGTNQHYTKAVAKCLRQCSQHERPHGAKGWEW